MTADEKEKVVELRLKGLGYQAIKFEADKITFTGFPLTDDSDLVTAFTTLAGKINTLALESKYIRVKKTPVENEKYTFRIWLVRLGLDGTEYKTTRKLLLSHLKAATAPLERKNKRLPTSRST